MTDAQVDALIKIIGLRLRKLRGKDKQELYADKAGVWRSKYSAMELGSTHYRIDAFIRVLAAFDIDILSVFDSRPKNGSKHPRLSEPHKLAIEQLESVLLAGGQDADGAIFSVERWYRSLPQKH